MKQCILTWISAVLLLPAIGQDVKVERRDLTSHWTVNPRSFVDDMDIYVKHVEAPLPGGDLKRQEMDALKRKMNERFPRVPYVEPVTRGGRSSDTVTVVSSFPADFFLTQNPMVGGTPNDNTLAISDDGALITSWNSQLWAYDVVADTYMFALPSKHPSFFQFMNAYNDTTYQLDFPFDPKLLYHPGHDRFVMLFLTGEPLGDGRDPQTSNTIVCFSSSSDPKDIWHAYEIDGNPLTYDTWADYPQIAMNEHSLYLTLNQLYPDSGWVEGFAETVMWQLDLEDAFNGEASVATKFWTGFEFEGSNIRYLHPVKTHMGPEGDSMYLIANRPFVETNDTFFLVSVVGSADDPNEDIQVEVMPSSLTYGHPPYAKQSDGTQEFWTNDARVLGAVRMGKSIQFTGNSIDTLTGKASIYHGVIADLDNPSVSGSVITHPDKELGFPNIEFIGVQRSDREVVIFTNHTGEQVHAGNSVIYVNNAGQLGPLQTVVDGESHVDAMIGSQERWGDYTGIQRKFNETAKVWVSGYWGHGNERPGTYVSEITSPKHGPTAVTRVEGLRANVYPNPVAEWVTFRFESAMDGQAELILRDANGRHVRSMGRTRFQSGATEVGFNIASLAPGLYFVEVRSEADVVGVHRFVKD